MIRRISLLFFVSLGWNSIAFAYSDLNQPPEQTTGGLCEECEAKKAKLRNWNAPQYAELLGLDGKPLEKSPNGTATGQ